MTPSQKWQSCARGRVSALPLETGRSYETEPTSSAVGYPEASGHTKPSETKLQQQPASAQTLPQAARSQSAARRQSTRQSPERELAQTPSSDPSFAETPANSSTPSWACSKA